MRITQSIKMTAVAAFVVLASCGKDGAVENEPTDDVSEISEAYAAVSRDWIPPGIVLPEPHTVIQDTKVGTRTHLLQVVVEKDPKEQLAQWQGALEAAGYEINDSMLSNGRILFRGVDVESGQIAVSHPEDQNGFMIQIDVSKVSE
jgi:hypothetical protein